MSHTVREIWEAGRKALGMLEPTPAEEAAEEAAEKTAEEVPQSLAQSLADTLEDREYRITFKNGCGTDCSGLALKHNFCFDPAQIESIVPVGEEGTGGPEVFSGSTPR